MRHVNRPLTATIAGIGVLLLLTAPGSASTSKSISGSDAAIQLAHMTGDPGAGTTGGGMMGPGMMGQGWNLNQGPAQRYGGGMMGPGMMGGGMMGPGMMGGGMMGPGMMGQGWYQRPAQGSGGGMMGPGMMEPGAVAPGAGNRIIPNRDLTSDDVRHYLQHQLEWQGNKRLKLGEVKEIDGDKIVADITTAEGSLVQRLEVDRHTGQMTQTE